MTKTFLKDLIERAVKTFAQSILAFLGVGVTIFDVDWNAALGVSATATLASVLTSLVSLRAGGDGTASLVSSVTAEDSGKHVSP